MVRPGLAQTQAVLARELTGGTDEASRLFRQSVTLTRQVERSRIELARLAGPRQADARRKRYARAFSAHRSTRRRRSSLTTQAALSGFPRYRAVSSDTIGLADLQKILRPGEAYYRMTIVGDHVYAMLVTPILGPRGEAAMRPSKQLDEQVDALRDTISKVENGQRTTYPFDVALSHQLYTELFGPFAAAMTSGQASDLRARRRDAAAAAQPAGHGSGVGRRLPEARRGKRRGRLSTSAASPGSAATATSAPRSARAPSRSCAARRLRPGRKEYLGPWRRTRRRPHPPRRDPGGRRPRLHPAAVLMEPPDLGQGTRSRGRRSSAASTRTASRSSPATSSPTPALEARNDLDQYRILHFATHGVVTARAAKCAAQPALLTSFGGAGSDGLLTFREIFDLHLDADLVILSACDTAGKASAAATQQAGLSTGGDVALDGLVRAFVGAGGRLVVASHWPVPDDYNATQRLITGPVLGAARDADGYRAAPVAAATDGRPNTSHPFYWSAFAAVGDGDIPVIRAVKPQIAAGRQLGA